jgi:hypothetical protein
MRQADAEAAAPARYTDATAWPPAMGGFTAFLRPSRPSSTARDQEHGMNTATPTYHSFREFYPFYLSEHRNRSCRRLHFAGTSLVIATTLLAVASARYGLLYLLPLLGYGFAWVGHFFFEKNRPATFRYPFYSLAGDFVMYKDILIGRIKL